MSGPKLKFTDTEKCRGFKHCKTCRDTGTAGESWRAAVARLYDVPAANWECRHGWKWGGEPGVTLRFKRWLNFGSKFEQTTAAINIEPCEDCRKRAEKLDGRHA